MAEYPCDECDYCQFACGRDVEDCFEYPEHRQTPEVVKIKNQKDFIHCPDGGRNTLNETY